MSMWFRNASPFGEVTGEAALSLESTYSLDSLSGAFKDMATSCVKVVKDNRMYRAAVAAGRRFRYGGTTDEVRQMFSVGELQQATSANQPYLVAEPTYRKKYNHNMAAGFEDGFAQHDCFRGSAIGLTDGNFRQVINGLSNSYTPEKVWTFTTPIDAPVLNKADQLDTMGNWRTALAVDWEDEDPYSQYNSACG